MSICKEGKERPLAAGVNWCLCPYHTCCHVGSRDDDPVWSHDLPTEPGWYWARKTGCYPVVVNLAGSGTLSATSYERGVLIWRDDGSFADASIYDQWWPVRIQEPGKEGGE